MTNAAMNEMSTLNVAFDADDQKLSDLEALDLVLQKPQSRTAFLEQIDRLVKEKEALLVSQESYKDLVSSTKEAFRFKTSRVLNTVVDNILKSKLDESISNATAEIDLLLIVKEHVENK